jgi:hypothetical protein
MIRCLLFYLSIAIGYRTERVVNIVWRLEPGEKEGYATNTVIRVFDYWHECLLMEKSCAIQTVAVIASPLTCPLDRLSHEHGCYSAQ